MTVRIGLTGPIGCGKSTVAGWLADRGARVIDADAIAREVSAPGAPAHDAILAVFGDAVRTERTLDRAALARIVFRDPDALARLEAIVHPVVRTRILDRHTEGSIFFHLNRHINGRQMREKFVQLVLNNRFCRIG